MHSLNSILYSALFKPTQQFPQLLSSTLIHSFTLFLLYALFHRHVTLFSTPYSVPFFAIIHSYFFILRLSPVASFIPLLLSFSFSSASSLFSLSPSTLFLLYALVVCHPTLFFSPKTLPFIYHYPFLFLITAYFSFLPSINAILFHSQIIHLSSHLYPLTHVFPSLCPPFSVLLTLPFLYYSFL